MKLKSIKVSGFKSFVDQTQVGFSAKIVGVVGPNGCGKSNVIDAVRWVMGESSAKMLRGDSMDDVIFNGSSSRKPVGRASVELLFDNSLGRIKSHYQQFSEISIKRVLNRTGQSDYRINDKKVRRKDVLDLFRGTGLGPRSYSIIEQGMVSRIVEAKPEDLRAYVEEAAGISKYKDRRRETENRIRQTRENIERSEDIRNELLSQLRRLKRQAQAAARYKKLQAKRREMLSILFRLRFDDFGKKIKAEQANAEQAVNRLEKAIAEQREIEASIEMQRSAQHDAQDDMSEIQAEFYKAGADISKLEQRIEHIKVSEAEDAKALKEVNEALSTLAKQEEIDQKTLTDHRSQLADLLPKIDAELAELKVAQVAYEAAREAFNAWQNQFSQHHQQQQTKTSEKQLQLSIIDQINRQQNRAQDRQQQLEAEHASLKNELDVSGILPQQEALKAQQANFNELQKQIEAAQAAELGLAEQVRSDQNQLNEQRAILSTTNARITSLQEFQAAALDNNHQDYQQWLKSSGLSKNQQLAKSLRIESGWERAADRVLAPFLHALVDESGKQSFWLGDAEHAITLLSQDRQKPNSSEQSTASEKIALTPLADFIQSKSIDIATLLSGVYVAEDGAKAQQHRSALRDGQRIVTRDGVVYGANWVSHAGQVAANTGYLVREEEVGALLEKKQTVEAQIISVTAQAEKNKAEQQSKAAELAALQAKRRPARQEIVDAERKIAQLSTAQEYTQSRLDSISNELKEIALHKDEEQMRLDDAQQTLETIEKVLETTQLDQKSLLEQERLVKSEIEKSNLFYRETQAATQAKQLEQTRLDTSISSIENGLARMAEQRSQFGQRKQGLIDKNAANSKNNPKDASSLVILDKSLQDKLLAHKNIEKHLLSARDGITGIDNAIRDLQAKLTEGVQAVNLARIAQEDLRMTLQNQQVRQQSLAEEAARDGCIIAEVILPDDCPNVEEAERLIADIERKVLSIGAVNLVAIDEYETQSERAEYLEKQHQDLEDALNTLEKVIRKIDKETRVRFEETYVQLNKSFSNYFPKLFGGGRASLNLTSDDWLTTGVSVLAQPPGKRNSTIHLLSGGEKALTAVSLLFALFELNPAPFCMMDEVDAPLDDANVERFCDTVKSLSEHAQIILITHNKITMQEAQSLIGVTMNEPGVSRVVSVDIEQALEMVDN